MSSEYLFPIRDLLPIRLPLKAEVRGFESIGDPGPNFGRSLLRCTKTRFGLQKILGKKGIQHTIGWVQLAANFLEEFQSAAERLSGVIRLHASRLIEERRTTPVLRELGEIDHEVFPILGWRGHCPERVHWLIESW